MKKILTMMLLVLVCSIIVQAQDADYQPLVREGVKWVNVLECHYHAESCHFIYHEFRGDTIVNGKNYKKCYQYTGDELDVNAVQPFCAMREEGHKVYEVPFNEDYSLIYFYSFDDLLQEVEETGEFMLFDFDIPNGRPEVEDIPGNIVTGVGYDSDIWGYALVPCLDIPSDVYYETHGFHHLEDMDGNILYQGAAFDREENIYAPLAREGVIWEYLYINDDLSTSIERFQIVGDTIIGNHRYDKVFRYLTDQLNPTNTQPVAYLDDVVFMGEGARNVNVITEPVTNHILEDFMNDFDSTYSMPADWWYSDYEHTGAREIYDFEHFRIYMSRINEFYGCNYFSAVDSVYRVKVGDMMNRCFDITGINIENGKWIEGVGIDGCHTGNLIQPLAVSGETGTQGLIRLTDLHGNTLYKGAYYSIAYELPKYDLNDDGKVDIADVNTVINAMLGKSTTSADITGDGKVDISDVNAVINVMLGK